MSGLQSAFNRWGTGLAPFVDSGVLGPYAERIGFVASAKVSLDACALSHITGKAVLEFVEQAQRQHPDAGSPELFPFWEPHPAIPVPPCDPHSRLRLDVDDVPPHHLSQAIPSLSRSSFVEWPGVGRELPKPTVARSRRGVR